MRPGVPRLPRGAFWVERAGHAERKTGKPAPSKIPAGLEDDGCERGQGEGDGVPPIVVRDRLGRDRACVAEVRPAVEGGVAVEDLVVQPAVRHTQTVGRPRHGREVAAHDQEVVGIGGPADEGQHAVLPVVAVDPFEAAAVEVELVERLLRPHETVQVGDRPLQALVLLEPTEVPLQALVEVPLVPLAELAPHEEQLLARMAPHVGIQQPQVGELLPGVAGHLVEERPLAVHDLVVREREDEVLVEGVDQAEGQLVVVILAVHRVVPHVPQRVVHPAHVPLEAEAEAAHEMKRFGIRPKVALLSHSNFGTSNEPSAVKMRDTLALLQKNAPWLEVDGEMHGDIALDGDARALLMPNSTLQGDANLLVCPNIDAANISYNLLKTAAGGNIAIGPVLLGAAKPVHILTPSATVRRIVNMTALTVADANAVR